MLFGPAHTTRALPSCVNGKIDGPWVEVTHGRAGPPWCSKKVRQDSLIIIVELGQCDDHHWKQKSYGPLALAAWAAAAHTRQGGDLGLGPKPPSWLCPCPPAWECPWWSPLCISNELPILMLIGSSSSWEAPPWEWPWLPPPWLCPWWNANTPRKNDYY